MNIGGGEAADQLVRMMLSGGEVAVRLGGSATKNLLAMSLALAKNHRKISGKIRMCKMLQQTRDLRVFPMTQEEYRDFRHKARGPKLLYAAIQNSRDTNDLNSMVDVSLRLLEQEAASGNMDYILAYNQGRIYRGHDLRGLLQYEDHLHTLGVDILYPFEQD